MVRVFKYSGELECGRSWKWLMTIVRVFSYTSELEMRKELEMADDEILALQQGSSQ